MGAYPLAEPPAWVFQNIGLVIARWALVDHLLENVTYDTLGLDRKEGRFSVTDGTPNARIVMLRKLINHRAIPIHRGFVNNLATLIKDTEQKRDQLAHGVWLAWRGNRLGLQVTKGSWQPPNAPKGQNVSKEVIPEIILITDTYFPTILKDITEVVSLVTYLHIEITFWLLSSPQRFHAPSRPDHPFEVRNTPVPLSPPAPSQA